MSYYKLNGRPALDSLFDDSGSAGATPFQQGVGNTPAFGSGEISDSASAVSTGTMAVAPAAGFPAEGFGLATASSPSTPTNQRSTNWSGGVLMAGSGESFSTVSAQWVIPSISQVPGVTTSDVAEWVGIDGDQSSDVCQAGVYQEAQTSNGQTTVSCQAWVEWYPADADFIAPSSFQVNPGNTIKVTVETSGAGATTATFILDNETTGQIYQTSLAAPSGTSLVGNSAEAIVETPELINNNNQQSQPPLADFLNSPVMFGNVSATFSNGSAASLSSAQSIGMYTDNNDPPGVSGSVQEAYGSIQPSSNSVTVTENDYWGGSGPVNPLGTVVAVGDFTANGDDDLAYYNSSTSTTTLQFLNGTAVTGGGVITNSGLEGVSGWNVVGAGDFTNNGYSDLIYYNSGAGVTELQFLNGTIAVGGGEITNSPFENNPSWTIAGVGDFNNDGYSDLAYYNANLGVTELQFLKGTTAIGGGEITNSPFENNPSWTIAGVGDFNGDGYSDFAYYNASLGVTELQFLKGTTAIGGGEITNSPFESNPSWTVVGVGNFTASGDDDLVYYNASLGVTELQFLNGTTAVGGGEITNSPFENNPSWNVAGVGDFNGDGMDDLLYYNSSTGTYEIQLLDGTTATSTTALSTSAALADLGNMGASSQPLTPVMNNSPSIDEFSNLPSMDSPAGSLTTAAAGTNSAPQFAQDLPSMDTSAGLFTFAASTNSSVPQLAQELSQHPA